MIHCRVRKGKVCSDLDARGLELLGSTQRGGSDTRPTLPVFEHGPDHVAAGRLDQSTADGHQLCPLDADRAASRASGEPTRHHTAMETTEREVASDLIASTSVVAQHVGRSGEASGPGQPKSGAKGQLRQSRLSVRGRGSAPVALFAMGSTREDAETGLGPQTPKLEGGTRDGENASRQIRKPSGDNAFPPDKTASCRSQGLLPDVHDFHRLQSGGSRSSPSSVDVASSQRQHTGGGNLSQAGEIEPIPARQQPQQATPSNGEQEVTRSALAKARFGNDSNHCYSNAVLLASYWAWSFTCSGSLLGRVLDRAILELCGKRRPLHVWSLLPWRQMMREWASPGIQHDAAEFLQFLAGAAPPGMLHSAWQARSIVQDEITITDQGAGCPLLLSVPSPASEHSTLQSMLDAWHSQASKHGFAAAPMSVVLQINRFQQVGDSWTKSTLRVQVPDTCSLPVFSNGLDVTFHRFRFRAGVIHLGPTPHTGHYRSILKPSAGQTFFITDDGVPAAKVTRAQEDMIRANLYLCFFTPDN